jgi:hypothetical protein
MLLFHLASPLKSDDHDPGLGPVTQKVKQRKGPRARMS